VSLILAAIAALVIDRKMVQAAGFAVAGAAGFALVAAGFAVLVDPAC
jgi:hypothetical protein